MKSEENDWRGAIGAGILITIVIALVVTATGTWGNEKVAAWVQAIGAIVTIFGGVLTVSWQISSQRRRDEDLLLERAKLVANALFQCRRCLTCYFRNAQHWDDADRYAEEANWWLDSLTSLPIAEFPSVGVHTTIGVVFSEARKFRSLYPPKPQSMAALLNATADLCFRLEEAEIAVEKHLNKGGASSPDQAFEIDGVTFYPAGRTKRLTSEGIRVEFGIQLKERKPVAD